jgi:hypothetical protein
MPDRTAEEVPLGSGLVEGASQTIQARSSAVERVVSDSVRSEAAQAVAENAAGPKGVTVDQARKSARIVDGVVTFGSPISKQ